MMNIFFSVYFVHNRIYLLATDKKAVYFHHFPHKKSIYLTWCYNLVWRNSNDLTIPRVLYASIVNFDLMFRLGEQEIEYSFMSCVCYHMGKRDNVFASKLFHGESGLLCCDVFLFFISGGKEVLMDYIEW